MKIEIKTEELRKYSIFVGTPMYGGQASGMYTKATNDLSMLCSTHGIPLKYYFLFNESLVQRARNYIVDEFLRSDCTHLLFIDADIAFNPKDALALLGVHLQDPDKYQIVTGPYPKKTIAWEKVAKAAQMGKADDLFHGFPKSVDGFATKYGQRSTKIGGNGKAYQWLKMEGSYGGKTGIFEYTKDANGIINHRFFNVPK